MKNSLKVKAFSILMLLFISMAAAVYLGHSSSIQLKQTAEFQATAEEPLRVAIECANGSYSRDDPSNDSVYSMQHLFESRGYETAIVNGTDIDTVEELNNYDVVVIGASGHYGDTDFSVFQSALKEWVQNGGGLVATGWALYAIDVEGVAGGDLDQILPVSSPYDYESSGNITIISQDNPITHGVDTFPIYGFAEFPYSHVANATATVLAYTVSTGNENYTMTPMSMPVVVSWSFGLGKTVYLGPIYFADFQAYHNEGLYTDVDAVRLLLNSVEWATGRPPRPILAKCLILSNDYADTCALDFTLKIPDVDFAWMDVSSETPTYSNLSAYDVVLLFEDGNFANAPNVGSAVYDYIMAGGNLVIGTFYEQDRSEIGNGWGLLETIDPFTSDGYGCAYSPDELNVSSIVAHPITSGVHSLWCDEFQGGVHAKEDTVVVANWTGTNELGEPCPLAGYRILEDNQRVVQISIYPNYGYYNTSDKVEGDFYTLWGNAIKWAGYADLTPPITSIDYTAYTHSGKDWLSAESDISLLAIDENSNVTATYYKIDNGSWQIYDQPFNLSGLDEEAHAIQYYSVDYFENVEEVKNQTVYLDATAPTIYTPVRYPTGTIQYGQAVTILVNINDSGCGVKEAILHYSLNNGTTWTNVTMNYNSSISLYEGIIPAQSSNMMVKYTISASDNVNNNAVQDNSGTYYSYPVIPEFSSTILLATFMLLTLMATILIKKRGKKVVQ
jgi:type 1 glutamine amidotransferase